MTEQHFAAIDLGTNSCRLVVADSLGHYVYNHSAATRLGEGMSKNNRFTDEAVARGLAVLKEFGEIIRNSHSRYRAVATAACRMATNGAEFVQRVKDECGVCLEVIDGVEEARLNMLGALANADKTKPYVLVYDIGGGSTEVTLANRDTTEIIYTVSIPWGARNASEHFGINDYNPQSAQAFEAEIVSYLQKFKEGCRYDNYAGQVSFVATSSTPLRLSAYINQRAEYNREAEDGSQMSKAQMDNAIAEIFKTTEPERAASRYVGEKRAPIFVSGCILLKTIYDNLQIPVLTASYKSAKDSIIMELIKEANHGTSD